MLINLSNHSSSKWSGLQLQAANENYGQVIDIPFPNIPPEANARDINEMALSYIDQITSLYKEHHGNITVHIMGEMTFTFLTVNALLKMKIPCIASTTNRIVTESEGQKTVTFQFTRFRKYTVFQNGSEPQKP